MRDNRRWELASEENWKMQNLSKPATDSTGLSGVLSLKKFSQNQNTRRWGFWTCRKCRQQKPIADFVPELDSSNALCKLCAIRHCRCGIALPNRRKISCSACQAAAQYIRNRRKSPAVVARSAAKVREKYSTDLVYRKKMIARASESRRNRKKKPGARTAVILAEGLRAALKNDGAPYRTKSKVARFLAIARCTEDQLNAHIERQFTRGMTRAKLDAGEIHIDHVLPISSFDHTDPKQVRRCWSLPNLRPMWARQNIAKGAKRTHLL